MRIKLDSVIFPPNRSSGLDPFLLISMAHWLRATTQDSDPIKVKREGELYRVIDGRHRVVGALIAGRHDVLAELDESASEKRTVGFSA
jgi:hypothetical protein